MAELYFNYGAMNSGKSTELIMLAKNYELSGLKVIAFKPKDDSKADNLIVNRTGLSREVDFLLGKEESLFDYLDLNNLPNAVFVDEAQFLTSEQIDELFKVAKDYDVKVYAYGIRSDLLANPFEGSTRLLTIADYITEYKSICKCGDFARFNIRLYKGVPIFEGDSVLIDDKKNNENNFSYDTACGNCYRRIRRKYDKNLPESYK